MPFPTFDPTKHPRAGGGRFGATNQAGNQAQAANHKEALIKQAGSDLRRADQLEQQITGLRKQLKSLGSHPHTSHTVAKRSSKAKTKGATVKKTTKTTAKAKSSKASTTKTATTPGRRQIQGKILILQGQVHTLRANALKLEKQAAAI